VTPPRLLLVALVLTMLCAVGGALAQVLARETAPRVAAPVPAAARGRAAADGVALARLRAWDERRGAAWASGDRAALRALYVPGSLAGRHDLAMLDAWTSRGLRVRGLRMQVLAARARVLRDHRVVVRVTDRVARAVAVGPGVRRALPRDAPSTRTVELVRAAGRWRVAAVRPVARPVSRPVSPPGTDP
jgi:hypothetical protein